MPLSLDLDTTFELYLDSDAEKPVETRPVFLVRPATMRTQRHLAKLIDDFSDKKKRDKLTSDGVIQRMNQVLSQRIVGWRNMGRDFEAEGLENTLEDVLSFNEGFELACKLLDVGRPSAAEKKA